MMNADRLTLENYASECAAATYDDCNDAEQERILTLSNSDIADLYLIETGDGIIITDEDREAFGEAYRRELRELREGEDAG